mgnify:CR=1 FL=1
MGWRDGFRPKERSLLDALTGRVWPPDVPRCGLYEWSRDGAGLSLYVEAWPNAGSWSRAFGPIPWAWPDEVFAVADPTTEEAAGGAVSRQVRVWLEAQKRLTHPGEILFAAQRAAEGSWLEAPDRFMLEEAGGSPVLNSLGGRWYIAVTNPTRDGEIHPGAWRVVAEPTDLPDDGGAL